MTLKSHIQYFLFFIHCTRSLCYVVINIGSGHHTVDFPGNKINCRSKRQQYQCIRLKHFRKEEIHILDTEKLANDLINHSEKALEKTIEHFTPIVSTIIYNVSGGSLSSADIEEITADTFITLWNNSSKIRPDRLKAFLCCIAKNKAKDKIKYRKKTVVNIDDVIIEDGLLVSEKIEQEIINQVLTDAINSLKEPDREIIIRYYYYYQKTSTISDIMNINVETVKSKIAETSSLKNA